MENIEIRKVVPNEIDQLQKIGIQTFLEAFSSENSEENMNSYLEKSFSTQKLKTELKDKNSEFYFALENKTVVGYLKINLGQSQTEIKEENAIEIERIYVLKEFYGKKIGQLLFEKAMEISRQKKVDYIWLGVWEENLRAIHFYQKNGFVVFDKHIFKLGDDIQTDLMMKLLLKE
ncbi:GNAT family N-acetyltransferase [Tenacibaculum sp. IB213877]|uniref:GNAT family N-acetyltransferase n=1 Tax=Tenacibaculum sp. IB213877 TaxID=3097351 RepID=UPI002A5A2807|nr:GNAT family N-acetyltransferase [Tenacibaculum sp. IB213877]MDY0779426.1 GNAT family N-acetyltransferase [Tenacibaculum sp. IB213877]